MSQPGTGRWDSPIVNKPPRKSSRLQNKPPAPYAARPRPFQSTTQQACTKPRRPQATKGTKNKKHPMERQGRCTLSRPNSSGENLRRDPEAEVNANQSEGVYPQQLSEEDIRSLYKEVMDTVKNSQPLKRTSSSRSLTLSQLEVDTVQTRPSSSLNRPDTYRSKTLTAFKILHHAKPPDHIGAAVERIVNAKVSESRLAELREIARVFRDRCITHVQSNSGEDDFLKPFEYAFESLGLETVLLHKKAEWRKELKPMVRQPEDYHDSVRPRKRRQLSAGKYVSSESSQTNAPTFLPADNPQEPSTMLPPPVPPFPGKEGEPYLKTTRPDASIGIQLSSLTSTLTSQNLDDDEAKRFIEWLNICRVTRESDGLLEPALIFVPSDRTLLLAFPFAVVEGKAYSTGKQIFEAENQAAVSAACGLKIQLDLDSLANSGTASSGTPPTSSNNQPPLFFSVTTQGPIHELWYHWTVVDKFGVRRFESRLWNSWNGLVLKRAEKFIVKLNNVVNWGAGSFMKSIAERLGKVAANTKDSWLR
ncbi:hypothetical protein GP486_003852 [Trichoglossum hirsutum]|uniref:Uncharacterized protein n=1 Tax=Trichoglossum hirsutum TaxID=265104 RepID=A0A9P8LC86_9PEZI|nr:hypothetical protein GP486_003852 [Trichoglossum hirsutum]